MTLNEKIIHLRVSSDMSQDQLAKLLNVSRQSISKWEKGEALPTVDKILDICKLFRLTADDLLNNSITINISKNASNTNSEDKYFGSEGFRGEANKDLTASQAFKIGRFLGWYYSSPEFAKNHFDNGRARILIAKDTRRSSYMFEYALCAGITCSGADAYILHVTTTPSVSYITKTEGFDCGVMITASHCESYINGIKLFNRKGEKLEHSVTNLITDYIDHNLASLGLTNEEDLPCARRENIGAVVDYYGGRNRYTGYLISAISTSFRGLKVGLDCGNGATWTIAKNVFSTLGAEVHAIGCNPDGLNINKDLGTTHIDALQKYVVDNKLDVGFAFDGDGDRCIAVDEKGKVIDGDKILYILAKRISRHGYLKHNTVVSTIISNSGFIKALKEIGISSVQTNVGDRYVYESMVNNDYWIGGEQTGHVILRKYSTIGDGVLIALKLAEEMIDTHLSISKLCEQVTLFPQVIKSIAVVDKAAVANDETIKEKVNKINNILNGNGRIILRQSDTEPLIRIMVEAGRENLCNEYINQLYTLIKKKGYISE